MPQGSPGLSTLEWDLARPRPAAAIARDDLGPLDQQGSYEAGSYTSGGEPAGMPRYVTHSTAIVAPSFLA